MDMHGYATFIKAHNKELLVPIVGVTLSTFTDYSLLNHHPLVLDFAIAISFCLAAVILLFIFIPLIQVVEQWSSKHIDFNLSWLVGAALMSMGMARTVMHLIVMKTQYAAFPFDPTVAFRLCALFIVSTIMIRGFEKSEEDKVKTNLQSSGISGLRKERTTPVHN